MSYRAGVIGTGGIAGMGILGLHDEDAIGKEKFQASHAGGYHQNSDIDLVAVADVDEQRIRQFGEAWDIPGDARYLDHESMLASEELDVVSVCTPTMYHHEHVIDAARSPAEPDVIWCEKPIATCVTDANEMISVCGETDTELVINHSFRFVDKIQALREQLENGLVGDVQSITAQFKRELLRNSTHLLDTLIFLLDFQATDVFGSIEGTNTAVSSLGGEQDVDDAGGAGMILSEDGVVAAVDCSIDRDIASMNVRMIGTEGKLALNNGVGEWRYWALQNGTHIEAPIQHIDGGWDWETDYGSAFVNAVSHVVGILNGTESNLSPGRSARESLEIITAFYVSHYTGSRVSLPLARPLEDVTISSW
jgi:predicted dehydrogenase